MDTVTYSDFPKICRICMSYGKLQPLLQIKALNVLHIILPVIDVTNDDLPQGVCLKCNLQLNEVQEFIEKGQRSHTLLDTLIYQKDNIEITTDDCFFVINNLIEEVEIIEQPENETNPANVNEEEIIRKDSETKTINNFRCFICGKISLSKRSFAYHMLAHRKESIYQCKHCPKKFPYGVYLRRHTMNVHGTKPFVCEICQAGYVTKYGLKDHMNQHTGETPYICNHCGEKFKAARHLTKHMYIFHNPNISKIPKANRRYIEKRVRLNLECKECGKTFASRSGFANHQLSHKGVKKYLCNICGRQFFRNSILQTHLQRHEISHSCVECGKSFSKKFRLLKHCRDDHLKDITEFKRCSYCPKIFIKQSILRKHIQKQHSNILSCQYCGKQFAFLSNLKIHLRVHNGEKPFMCCVCGKIFSQKQTLTVHMRRHTGITPFACQKCDKKYPDSTNLKRHIKKHHQTD